MPDHRATWLAAVRAMTCSPELAQKYLDERLGFTTAVASDLVGALAGKPQVVYGVWLEGHGSPVYVGQTTEGRRRLWDLPIGESHHLANSFPPEVWDRVVVVRWGDLLDDHPDIETGLARGLDAAGLADDGDHARAIGLGLEHLLQAQFRPLMNRRKKRRDGTWNQVNWATSQGIGAKAAPLLGQLFAHVDALWSSLSYCVPPEGGTLVAEQHGVAVFPSRMRGHQSL